MKFCFGRRRPAVNRAAFFALRLTNNATIAQNAHPMQKPVELYAVPIRNHTKAAEIVAEPFAGSGTQFIAAESEGRVCYGLELEPRYAAVCLERMANIGLRPRLAED